MEIRRLMRIAKDPKKGVPVVQVKYPYKYENRWRTKYPEYKPNR